MLLNTTVQQLGCRTAPIPRGFLTRGQMSTRTMNLRCGEAGCLAEQENRCSDLHWAQLRPAALQAFSVPPAERHLCDNLARGCLRRTVKAVRVKPPSHSERLEQAMQLQTTRTDRPSVATSSASSATPPVLPPAPPALRPRPRRVRR